MSSERHYSCLIHICEKGCLLLLSMFTELSLRYWSSRHTNLSTYQVSSLVVAFFVSYMHVHAPFIMYCTRLFIVVFQEMHCLYIFKHDVVHRVTQLHFSTKFHAHQCCF